MPIYESIIQTIGNTPMLRLSRVEKQLGLECELMAKLEYFNPSGSIKDRAALNMLDEATKKGLLGKDTVIIEPTSGNTGIGLAMVCAVRGHRLILTMPESMSLERRKLLQAYGAELVLTPAAEGMQGAVSKAKQLAEELGNAFILGQFENPANAQAHIETTGPEIWNDCAGKLDCVVACVGTGGTVSGLGQHLKQQDAKITVVAVEPAASPLLSEGRAGSHGIQGIGANFVPEILDRDAIDEIATVTEQQAFEAVRMLSKAEGIFVGISSGAAMHAAIAKAKKTPCSRVVVIMPDSGERYLSVDAMFE